MSYRRLWVLLRRLPQESWTQTELRDSEPDGELAAPVREQTFGPWALTNYQLATLTDAVRHGTFVLARVNGNDWEQPDPAPRPGAKRVIAKRTPAQVVYLNSLRARPPAG